MCGSITRRLLWAALACGLLGACGQPEIELTLRRSSAGHEVSLEVCQPAPNTPCKSEPDIFGSSSDTELTIGLYIDDGVPSVVLKFDQSGLAAGDVCRQLTVQLGRDEIDMVVRLDANGDLDHAGCPNGACAVQTTCSL